MKTKSKSAAVPTKPSTPRPFVLAHEKHIPKGAVLEAIVEYAEIPRGSTPARDTKGYINRLVESAAFRVGISGLVPKDQLAALSDELSEDFIRALGGYGAPKGWKVLPALGAQGVYKSRHGWIAWRVGGASNDYAKLAGTIEANQPLSILTIK